MRSTRPILFFPICLLIFMAGCQSNLKNPDKSLGFPFQIASAKTEKIAEDSSYRLVEVIMARNDFLEENLDKLFRHLRQQHANENKMVVRVYVDFEKFRKSEMEMKESSYGNDIGSNSYSDAIFYKFGESEWFIYSLDLTHGVIYNFNASKEGKAKAVVMKEAP